VEKDVSVFETTFDTGLDDVRAAGCVIRPETLLAEGWRRSGA